MKNELALRLAGAAVFASTAIFVPSGHLRAEYISAPPFPTQGIPSEAQKVDELVEPNFLQVTSFKDGDMIEEELPLVDSQQFKVQKPLSSDSEEKRNLQPDFDHITEAATIYELEKSIKAQAPTVNPFDANNLLFLPTVESRTSEQVEFQQRYNLIASLYRKWQPNSTFFLMYNDGGGVISVIDPQKPEFFNNAKMRDFLEEVVRDYGYVDGLRDELIHIAEETGVDKGKFNINEDMDYVTLLLSDFEGHQGQINMENDKFGKKWLTTTVSLRSPRYVRAEAVTTALPPTLENTQYENSWYRDTINNRVAIEAQSNTTDRAGVLVGPSYSRYTNIPGGLHVGAIVMEKLAKQGLVDGNMYEFSIEEQAMRYTSAILNKLGLTNEIIGQITEKNPDPRFQKVHAHVLAFLSTFSQLESQEVQNPVQTADFERVFEYIKTHTPNGVIPQGYGWEGMEVVMPRPLSSQEVQMLQKAPMTAIIQSGSSESPNRDFAIYNLGVSLTGTGNHGLNAKAIEINPEGVKIYAQIATSTGTSYLPITQYCVTDLRQIGTQSFTCPKEVKDITDGSITSIGEFIVVFDATNPYTGQAINLGVHVDRPIDMAAQAQTEQLPLVVESHVDKYLFPEGYTWDQVEEGLLREYTGDVPFSMLERYKQSYDLWSRANQLKI